MPTNHSHNSNRERQSTPQNDYLDRRRSRSPRRHRSSPRRRHYSSRDASPRRQHDSAYNDLSDHDYRSSHNSDYYGRRDGDSFRSSKYQTTREEEEWINGEDAFALRQAKKGAMIRISERRAKPIDWLAMNMRTVDEDKDVYDSEILGDKEFDIPFPHSVMEGLSTQEINELEDDIKKYLILERKGKNHEFWEAMLVLCDDKKRNVDQHDANPEARVVKAVSEDIEDVLRNKSLQDLEELEDKIEMMLSSDAVVDVDFWSELKKELLTRKAKAKLNKIHNDVVQERRKRLERDQATEAKRAMLQIKALLTSGKRSAESSIVYSADMDDIPDDEADKVHSHELQPLAPDEFSKKLLEDQQRVAKLGFIPMKSLEEDHKIFQPKKRVKKKSSDKYKKRPSKEKSAADRFLEREMARGTRDNEELFNVEEVLDTTELAPGLIKPRFHNRIQTGYDWNRYNQTHYSHSDPPPKTVQGYRFNMFYPELFNTSRAPTYKIIRDRTNHDDHSLSAQGQDKTCIIKFIAGPPYADVAFRIVDREWDYSSRRENGFRCSFDKGTLQLHFRFKKTFYRK
ncbi:cactus-binding C-terminus of cactin protein-domain-containing protein [Lipomyces japonicus]|uniref:cactus-binding C-terminus of cactin protein-domain-containing protein n=1 Tax=Lipomyces japonicus TaxID=56871 RepID=UPI0034CE156D